jgi:hypothetical protein
MGSSCRYWRRRLAIGPEIAGGRLRVVYPNSFAVALQACFYSVFGQSGTARRALIRSAYSLVGRLSRPSRIFTMPHQRLGHFSDTVSASGTRLSNMNVLVALACRDAGVSGLVE